METIRGLQKQPWYSKKKMRIPGNRQRNQKGTLRYEEQKGKEFIDNGRGSGGPRTCAWAWDWLNKRVDEVLE